ncbi:hypothetical protein DFQ12_1735 [Sphingobacterium detergens]|uniref:Uncharacterized protein n=1 Tax=Sphingobacterium detergens TaxID=1145106 RepID=A0A420BJH2_SPHD1|nr:hypothetical protein DFQ12_1735 [Sphingobacterium detergens]
MIYLITLGVNKSDSFITIEKQIYTDEKFD